MIMIAIMVEEIVVIMVTTKEDVAMDLEMIMTIAIMMTTTMIIAVIVGKFLDIVNLMIAVAAGNQEEAIAAIITTETTDSITTITIADRIMIDQTRKLNLMKSTMMMLI